MSHAADASAASPPFRAEPLLRSPGDRRQAPQLDPNHHLEIAARREKSHRSPVPCVAHDTYTFHHNCGCVTPPRVYAKMQRKSPIASHGGLATNADVPLLDPMQEVEGRGTTPNGAAMATATHEVACFHGPSRASFVSVMKDNSPAAVLLLTVSRGRGPRSVVHTLEMREDRIYLVERDALSGVLIDERRAPISKDTREPQPTCMVVVCEAVMIGLSDGVILCWEKLLSSSSASPPPSSASPVGLQQSRLPQPHLTHGGVGSPRSPFEGGAPAEIASHCVDTVLSRWTRLGATAHHSSLIGLWSLGDLAPSKAHSESDAMISVCASGQALVWCRTAPATDAAEDSVERPLRRFQWFARSLVAPPWRNIECSSSLFWSSLHSSRETTSMRAYLALGTKCGKVITWVAPSGFRSEDSHFSAAELMRCVYQTDVGGHVAVTSLANAQVEHRGPGSDAAATETHLLCAGLASGSVNIYAYDHESAASSGGGGGGGANCWRCLRQVEVFSHQVMQGLTFIDSVRCWCTAANGHVAIVDCVACAVIDRVSLEGGGSRHRKLTAHGRRLAALVHAEFVCGHILWSVDSVGIARNVLVPSELLPHVQTLHHNQQHSNSHLTHCFRVLSHPSLDDDVNLSFAARRPSEDAVSTNTAPLSDDLAEFERMERAVAGASTTRADAAGGSALAATKCFGTGATVSSSDGGAVGTSSGSTADFVEFLKTAGCELQMVQQRLDEHLVVLHDVVEDQLLALCNLRSGVATATSGASGEKPATSTSPEAAESPALQQHQQLLQSQLVVQARGTDAGEEEVNDLAERVAILTELLAAKDRQLDEQAHALQVLTAMVREKSSSSVGSDYPKAATSPDRTAENAPRVLDRGGVEADEVRGVDDDEEQPLSRGGGGATQLSAPTLMLNVSARSEDDSRISPISIPDHSAIPPVHPIATAAGAGNRPTSAGDVTNDGHCPTRVGVAAEEESAARNGAALNDDGHQAVGDGALFAADGTAADAQIHLYQRMLTLEQDTGSALRQSLSVVTAQVGSLTQERDALSLRCAGLEDKATQLEAALQRHAEALQGADAELSRTRAELDQLQRIAAHTEQRYDVVAAENASLRERLKAVLWTKDQITAQSPPSIKRKSSAAAATPMRDVQHSSQPPPAPLENEAALLSSEGFDAQLDVIEAALACLSSVVQHSGGTTTRLEQLREELLEVEQQRSGERKQWMAKYMELQDRNGKEVEVLRRKLDDVTRERNAAAAVCAAQHSPAIDERDHLREEKKRLVNQLTELLRENDLLRAEAENKETIIIRNKERESQASEESMRLRDVLVDLDERGSSLAEEIAALTASRDYEASRAAAAEAQIRKLVESESALQSAANELALRLAFCEEQVGVWQAKFGEVEEELRQRALDSNLNKTSADRARASEREAQEEICDLRRKLHETVAELQRNLGNEIRMRLLEEQKVLHLQQEKELLQQQQQLARSNDSNDQQHPPVDVVALQERNALLSKHVDELEVALAAATSSAATHVATCELNVGSPVLEAENNALRKQINQLNWRIASLGKQLEGKPTQAQRVAAAGEPSAFSKRGNAKSPLDARQQATTIPSNGFVQARKVREVTAKPDTISDRKGVPDGRDVPTPQMTTGRRSNSNNERRSPYRSSSHRQASDDGERALDGHAHSAHHRHGHGQASDCVWCSGVTFKSMGGTFGVNTAGTRFLEFDRSPTSGHGGSQLFAGNVSPTPEKRSLSARTVSPPVTATLVSPRAVEYRGASQHS